MSLTGSFALKPPKPPPSKKPTVKTSKIVPIIDVKESSPLLPMQSFKNSNSFLNNNEAAEMHCSHKLGEVHYSENNLKGHQNISSGFMSQY